jgi:Intracellular proteinase inhibitor
LTPLVLLVLAAAVGRQPDSMRVELVVPPKVAPGEPVPIAIQVTNTADRPIELHLQGRTTVFDLVVSQGNTVVWHRLEGASVPAILQLRMLAPGEVLELKDAWQQKDGTGRAVGPGEYSVTGFVPTDAAPLRVGPVTLVIDG